MSQGRKEFTAGEWRKTSAGRPYRFIDIEGNQYCQWDHPKGPVLPADSLTPRTTNPRNDSGPQTGSTQSTGFQSTSEGRPIPSRHDSLNAAGSTVGTSGQTTYGSDPFPPEGHQNAYALFPRDARTTAGISEQHASSTLPVRTAVGHDERDRPLVNDSNRVTPGRPAAAETRPRDIANAHRSGQARTDSSHYPPGTKKVVRKSDRTYYLDGDGNVIKTIAATPPDPRPDYSHFTTDEVTHQLSTMNTQGESWREGDARRPSRHAADPREEFQAASIDQRDSSARRQIPRYGSQGSVLASREERSQSRERAEVHQSRPIEYRDPSGDRDAGIDRNLSNRPASDPHRPSSQDIPVIVGRTNTTHVQSPRPAFNEGTVPKDAVTGTRYPPATPKAGLDTISELGCYKGTWIKGDDRYGRSKETIDSRKATVGNLPECQAYVYQGYFVRSDVDSFFSLGRVFALLWHEPAGSHGTDLSDGEFYTVKFGQKVYSTIRRMVVVRRKHGHSICVPISTYGGRGTLKPGLSLADIEAHAVIYMAGTPSDADPRERMVKRPIAVKPAKEDQKLHRMSRINFDKIYTIEHNVKVMNVGKVLEESIHNLSIYFRNTNLAG